MKQYRLGYHFLFSANPEFKYKNGDIGGMSFDVLFKMHDESGEEIFFESDDEGERVITSRNGKTYYLFELITCSFDREEIITINPNTPLVKELDFSLSWEIESYFKAIDRGILESEEITESEFMDIMKNNKDAFDNSDNRSAQTMAYFTQEIGVVAN